MTREEALQILDTIPTISEQVDALEMAIQALSQEPCDKCKYFDGNSCQHYDYKVGYTQGYKDAQKQKSGKWTKMFLTDTRDIYCQCSECGFIHKFIDGHTAQYNFCPNCAAKMESEVMNETDN